MKILIAFLLATFGLLAQAADRGTYDWYTGIDSYPVIGAFDDTVEVTIWVAKVYSVTVSERNAPVPCTGRACRSKGSILTSLATVQFLGSGVLADVVPVAPSNTATVSLFLTPGVYTLHVVGAGQGTGTWLGHGEYDISIH